MGVSLGLVGLGSFGTQFADLFRSHPLVDRVALCDREADRIEAIAKRPGFDKKYDPKDAFTNLDDLLRTDVDAVVVITQPWLHPGQAIQAMEAGKHVYSAVPIVSLPDGHEILDWCDRLIRTCERTGMRYMLGETTFYRPETMYCRRRAAEGAFGRFVHADAQYAHDVDSPSCNLREVGRARGTGAAGAEWREKAKTYRERGIVSGPMHYPTHSVAGPVSVMGAHAVRVMGCGVPDDDSFFGGSFGNETAFFTMSNGATMRIGEWRHIGQPEEEMFRVFGTQGTFRERMWGTNAGFQGLKPEEMRDALPEEVHRAFEAIHPDKPLFESQVGHGGSHPFLVHEFVSAVAENREPAINAWEAVRYMAPGVMAHQSALKGGETMDVPDWGDGPGRKG